MDSRTNRLAGREDHSAAGRDCKARQRDSGAQQPGTTARRFGREYQLKAAEADYENLKVQVNSDLLKQKAVEAAVRSDYEQAKIQHEVDEKLRQQGIGADVTAKLSQVKE